MSTKASSAINASANNSPTNSTMNTTTSSTTAATPTVVKIKKELPSDEIKEFAESTMNELLGWYGFDSVDRLDLSAKTSKLLQTAGIISAQQHQQQQQQQQHHHQQQQHHLEKRRSRSSRAASLLHMHQQQQQNEHLRTLNNNHNNSNNNSNNNNNNIGSSVSSSNNRKTSLNCNNNTSSNINSYRGNDSTTSDHDTRSSRDDDSKSPNSAGKTYSTTTNIIDDKIVDYQNCCWCRRPVPENAPEFLTTSDGPRYCSESCFTQSRRASFKKAKTCDWCKHVRHAVSYVDFQDGASQLQFCSDKCLNQYKMQIFCKETQAHLDMNPHLKEQGLEAASNGANLITPDLWLRNCRSRSASPASTVSISPGPPGQANICNERSANSPLPRLTLNNSSLPLTSNTSHKPLISVAPVSKLMSKSPSILANRQSPKHNRKKRPVRACVREEMLNTRNSEVKSNCSPSLAPVSIKPKPLMASLNDNNRSGLNQSNSQSLTQFAASGVQDLHMNVPPLSPLNETHSSQPTTPHSLPPTPNRGPTAIPPAFFATTPNNQATQNAQTMGFAPRPPFMPNPNNGFLPRFLGNFGGLPPPPPHAAAALMPPELTALNTLIGTPPPVTIMVPYPVIIPLPIPIPVPLPIVDFYKAHLTPEERKKYEEEQQQMKQEKETTNSEPPLTNRDTEEPLDFTKTKELEQESVRLKDTDSPKTLPEVDDTKEVEQTSEETKNTNTEVATSRTRHLQCVLSSEEAPQTNTDNRTSTTKLKSDFVASNQDTNEDSSELQGGSSSNITASGGGGGGETNQKLPKLKITRLQTKRTLIQTKESECSRPLRKRKRIIDCDFQKLNSTTTSNKEVNEPPPPHEEELNTTTENETPTHKGQTNNSNNNNKK
ncbi:sine oculis-binding protein homolog A-like isoform X1 [Lucilia sericata]|uniref:sine oculis-binding protein homolog A-like isoform X1 n=1 Tax=Lucilia sericata TaxID=13632 RepID=UPI0018A81F78|nr:sine oculis-binding protein homolog A-like isoform X1 [Lucilia sericata]XP_037818544.1 sine oculis-binding protein homolog A-like isoform X1 [Lucilia sericata]